MRILQYNEHCEDVLSEVADNYGVDKEKLWEMYLDIMKRNYFEDLCDIAGENLYELGGNNNE